MSAPIDTTKASIRCVGDMDIDATSSQCLVIEYSTNSSCASQQHQYIRIPIQCCRIDVNRCQSFVRKCLEGLLHPSESNRTTRKLHHSLFLVRRSIFTKPKGLDRHDSIQHRLSAGLPAKGGQLGFSKWGRSDNPKG